MPETRPAIETTTREAEFVERDLIGKMILGDEGAWQTFVLTYQNLVASRVHQTLNRCWSIADESARDDLIAEIFSSLLLDDKRVLRQFLFQSSIATWLTVIAHRICLRRSSQRRRSTEFDGNEIELSSAIETSEPSPLGNLLRLEENRQVRQAMAKLNPQDIEVLQLFHFQGLGYREIGKRMKLSINSVGPRLHRAQQRLRRLMEERE